MKKCNHSSLIFILGIFLISGGLLFGDPLNVGAYYQNWSQFHPAENDRRPFSLDMIDTDLISDLFYAFAVFGFETESISPSNPHLTGDFTVKPLQPRDQDVDYQELKRLKARSGGKLRLFLSIGGDNFNNPNDPYKIGTYTHKLFSQMVSLAENRKQFIESCINYAHRYGFDGIDIDWEYPGDVNRGGNENDFDNFPIFIKECASALHQASPPLLLSLALPATIPYGVPKRFLDNPETYYRWIANCAEYADRVTIMAYNYHAPFDELKITGANAPLLRDTDPASTLYIARTLENYLRAGLSPKKGYLGVALYGWLYKGVDFLIPGNNGPGKKFTNSDYSSLPYYKISDQIAKKIFSFGVDTRTNTAYSYNYKDRQWVSFDVPETNVLKVNEAKKLGLGGVVFWSIDQDEYQWPPTFPNIRAAERASR